MSQQQTYQAFARLVRIDSRSCSRSRPSPLSSGFQLPVITSMCFGFFGGIASLSLHQDSLFALCFLCGARARLSDLQKISESSPAWKARFVV